jgi:hypothetical protein
MFNEWERKGFRSAEGDLRQRFGEKGLNPPSLRNPAPAQPLAHLFNPIPDS